VDHIQQSLKVLTSKKKTQSKLVNQQQRKLSKDSHYYSPFPPITSDEKKTQSNLVNKQQTYLANQDEQESEKKKRPLPAAVTPRKKRVLMGFSYESGNIHKRGKLPTCKGCNETIKRNEARLLNTFKKCSNHNFPTEDRYHLSDECVNMMSVKHLKHLKTKKFREEDANIFLQHLQTPSK
jgi:hypothetical protein